MSRPSWDIYFSNLAQVVATRADCDRKKVGSVIVNADHRIVSSGYNGAPAGLPDCDTAGHELREINGRPSCVRTLHAESNALDYAGGIAKGCTLYVTCMPCYNCAKRIVNVGVLRVVYGEYYESQNTDLVAGLFKNNVFLSYVPPDPVRVADVQFKVRDWKICQAGWCTNEARYSDDGTGFRCGIHDIINNKGQGVRL